MAFSSLRSAAAVRPVALRRVPVPAIKAILKSKAASVPAVGAPLDFRDQQYHKLTTNAPHVPVSRHACGFCIASAMCCSVMSQCVPDLPLAKRSTGLCPPDRFARSCARFSRVSCSPSMQKRAASSSVESKRKYPQLGFTKENELFVVSSSALQLPSDAADLSMALLWPTCCHARYCRTDSVDRGWWDGGAKVAGRVRC
jgi:hypothetical protein